MTRTTKAEEELRLLKAWRAACNERDRAADAEREAYRELKAFWDEHDLLVDRAHQAPAIAPDNAPRRKGEG